MTFARRIQEIEPFLAVEVAERAQELERAGIDVVHLEFGEPDFEAPPAVLMERESVRQLLGALDLAFESLPGVLEARQRIELRTRA